MEPEDKKDELGDEYFINDFWDDPPVEVSEVDENGDAHCDDGPAGHRRGEPVWFWHGHEYDPDRFNDAWPDARKVWWMRAKMEGA